VLVDAQKQLFDVIEATGVAAGIGGSSTMSFGKDSIVIIDDGSISVVDTQKRNLMD
jgi:hypothetical protein